VSGVGLSNPNDLVGAILNQRWRLVALRGEGGLGLVYEAEGVSGQGARAIKLLRPEFSEDAAVVQRFLEEAETNGRIDHPGVVKVYEAARAEDGSPYLLMELLYGQPLAAVMNRRRLSVEQVVLVASSVLSVIACAHASGVVHRDLKPDNVMVLERGAGRIDVKVLDFGVARVMDAAGGMARKTHTGMLLGTPGYMSPEQIRNVKHADARTDLWSVGVIVYEMLTGTPAFGGDNDFNRITQVLGGDIAPIEDAAPQYAHWRPFFERALAKEPAQRFQTAAEMEQALREIAEHGQMRPSSAAALRPVLVAASAPPDAPAGPFGGTGTAVSAGAGPTSMVADTPSVPLVQVLPSLPSGLAVRWVIVCVAVALAVGFSIGFVVAAGAG